MNLNLSNQNEAPAMPSEQVSDMSPPKARACVAYLKRSLVVGEIARIDSNKVLKLSRSFAIILPHAG